jgi:hypothetical protein
LQKRPLLYETQKKLKANAKKNNLSLMMLNFVIQGLYDIKITSNKFCIAKMYSCMCGALYLKKPSQTGIGHLLQKLEETPFSFLHDKIALDLELL